MFSSSNQPVIAPLPPEAGIPYGLLLLADPSKAMIDQYLSTGYLYAARLNGETIGVYVLVPAEPGCMEIKNIAVARAWQGKGIGRALLQHACSEAAAKKATRIRIATGNSSIGQLYLYQQAGFELTKLVKDFFTRHYPQPIVENGITCKHLLVLEKEL
jgi:aminoglycoside 6'-N-acetyltransferase I